MIQYVRMMIETRGEVRKQGVSGYSAPGDQEKGEWKEEGEVEN